MAFCSCYDSSVEPYTPATLVNAQTLRTRIKGSLVEFGQPGYDEARLLKAWDVEKCKLPKGQKVREFTSESHPTETWNLDTVKFPSAICTVSCTDDVAETVKFAAAEGLSLCIAGGRHSHHCLKNDSLVIDLRLLRTCIVDPVKRTMVCEGGALNGDAHAAMAGTGLGMTLGHHPGTGLGGLVLQGGHGPLEKVFGLSVDALFRVDVVLASGEQVQASDTENTDLFWALRGGCGNFGVVVAFHFNLFPMPEEFATLLRVHLPLGLGPLKSRLDLIKNFRDNCKSAALTTSPLLICPMGGPVIERYYHIGDQKEGQGILDQYNTFGKPFAVEAVPHNYYHEIAWDILGPDSKDNLTGNYYTTSALLSELPDEACQILADYLGTKGTAGGESSIIINQLGGKAAEIPTEATAVGRRDGKYWIIIVSKWKAGVLSTLAQNREKSVKWGKDLRTALMPWAVGRYGQLSKEDWGDVSGQDELNFASWGSNYVRLQQIKAKYDAKNLFRNNDNIKA